MWATIVKDPIFQEQNRRSTDLRDRFRNAFPELYQAAGYKPRNNTSKKKKEQLVEGSRMPGRAATDDQIALSSSGTTGPVRGVRRRRAQTSQGILLRGGTKSVPQSTACSEDEDSSGQEDEDGEVSSGVTTNVPKTPLFVDNSSTTMSTDGVEKNSNNLGLHLLSPSSTADSSFPGVTDDDDEMGMRLISLGPLSDPLSEYLPSSLDTHTQQNSNAAARHSGVDTPTHSHHTWSSPQSGSNNVNDGGGGGSNPTGSSVTSNNNPHAHSQPHNSQGGPKIGQSAWGTQDWLSPNPRLDHSFTANTNTNANESNTPGTGTPSSYFSPSSPFASFNLTPLNTTHPLSPATTTTAGGANPSTNTTNDANASSTNNPLVGNLTTLTTLNLPMNNYINYYSSHQHHGVIERYDLWPPSSSALSLSSSFSAVNNSSAWSSALSSVGSGGGMSGPGSLSAFSSSFGGDLSSEVSLGDTQSTFSDDGGVFGNDGTYNNMGYSSSAGVGNNNTGGAGRAITHHSDYAGDLIFGARGYGIGGGFGWFGGAYAPGPSATNANTTGNTNATGLGLVGITKGDEKSGRKGEEGGEASSGGEGDEVIGDGKGSINPMQLHTPSGIDEIALAGINLNDSQDVDETMDEVMDDAMDGTSGNSNVNEAGGMGLTLNASPLSAQQDKGQQGRGRASGSGKSMSANASPEQTRRVTLGRIHSTPMSPLISHTPHHHPSHNPSHSHSHSHQLPHTPTHNHSLSLSIGHGATHTSPTTPNPFGRFSLDDLDIVDLTQAQNMVDMNNLTPPATPMMQHVTQMRGLRRYSVFGVGLGAGTGAGTGGGLGFLQQGQGQGQGQSQGGAQGGQGGRSISVPPSEAKNASAGAGSENSLGMSFSGGNASGNASHEGVERGRPTTSAGIGSGSGVPSVKRSLSSTVHHSHGQGHGHSLSMSTLPPLPSHSEIWRSKTPVAKTSSGGAGATSPGSVSASAATSATAGTGTTASLFSNLFASPPPSSSAALGFGGQGSASNNNMHLNAEYTNPDLPFLDLHYNFGHQNQLQQQGFAAMLVDTPSTTATTTSSVAGTTGTGVGMMGMTQAEVEARQALDLAQPLYTGHHGHHMHGQQQSHGLGQGQGSGFGFANASNASSGSGGAGAGLKALVGNAFNTPLSLTRQLSQFSAAARQSQQQQQGQGHQRVQSQQVVNPKDLVLNAGMGSQGGAGGLRLDNKRKRASWDGGLV